MTASVLGCVSSVLSVPHVFSDGALEGRRVAGEDQEEEAVWGGRGEPAAAEPGVRRQLHARSRSGAQRPEAGGRLSFRGLKQRRVTGTQYHQTSSAFLHRLWLNSLLVSS